MINKDQLLQMTSKEIEKFLNDNIITEYESIDQTEVKDQMIEDVSVLFDDSIIISVPYYTNREFVLVFKDGSALGDDVRIIFKVSAKNTGKTKKVTRLKRKDVKTVGKFKFDSINISFYNPIFVEDDLVNYKVKLDTSVWSSGGATIYIKRKEKLIDIFSRDILEEEIQKDDAWKNIRTRIISNASQPKLHKERMYITSERWDKILQKTEKNNKELIDSVIETIFKVI